MDMPSAIRAVTERRDLTHDEMQSVMNTIMTGGHPGTDRRLSCWPAHEG